MAMLGKAERMNAEEALRIHLVSEVVAPERLLDDAQRLLDAPDSPTWGLAEVFSVPHEGGTRLFVRRQTGYELTRAGQALRH